MKYFQTSSYYSRLADLFVLCISFLLFSWMVGTELSEQLLINMAFYAGIVFILLRLSKRLFFQLMKKRNSRISCVLVGNVVGLVVGTMVAMFLQHWFPGVSERSIVIILSSILAFFVLGTISPMVKSSHRDIIPH